MPSLTSLLGAQRLRSPIHTSVRSNVSLSLGGIPFLVEALPECDDHLHEPAIRTSQLCALSLFLSPNFLTTAALPEYV